MQNAVKNGSIKKQIKKSSWVGYACIELSYAWLASLRELKKRVISYN